jgi:hypothetical protein
VGAFAPDRAAWSRTVSTIFNPGPQRGYWSGSLVVARSGCRGAWRKLMLQPAQEL